MSCVESFSTSAICRVIRRRNNIYQLEFDVCTHDKYFFNRFWNIFFLIIVLFQSEEIRKNTHTYQSNLQIIFNFFFSFSASRTVYFYVNIYENILSNLLNKKKLK